MLHDADIDGTSHMCVALLVDWFTVYELFFNVPDAFFQALAAYINKQWHMLVEIHQQHHNKV